MAVCRLAKLRKFRQFIHRHRCSSRLRHKLRYDDHVVDVDIMLSLFCSVYRCVLLTRALPLVKCLRLLIR